MKRSLLFLALVGFSFGAVKGILEERSRYSPVKEEKKEERIRKAAIKKYEKIKKPIVSVTERDLEKKYTYAGTGAPLGKVLGFLFGKEYSIVFDSGADPSLPVKAIVRNATAEEACKLIARSVGFYCDFDGKRKVMRISLFKEEVVQLPFSLEDINFDVSLGGNILGIRPQVGRGGGGGGGGGSGTLTGGSRLNLKGEQGKKNFEELLKTALGDGEVKVDWATGVVFLKGTPEGIERVKKVIRKLDELARRYVNVEVRLSFLVTNRNLETGVDLASILRVEGEPVRVELGAGLSNSVFSIAYRGNKLRLIFSALEELGDLKDVVTLKGRTQNGKPLMLVRGTYYPYVTYQINTSTSGQGIAQNVVPQENYVFDGVQFLVKPVLREDTIDLVVYPAISSLEGYRSFTVPGLGSTVDYPIVSSTSEALYVHMNDGETVVIGGLVWDGKKRTTTGIPLLDRIPILGKLFSKEKVEKKRIYMILSIYAKGG